MPVRSPRSAAILPGVLLQSAYSRTFEQQADDDAAALLRRHGEDPGQLADLLERMERENVPQKRMRAQLAGIASRHRGAGRAPAPRPGTMTGARLSR